MPNGRPKVGLRQLILATSRRIPLSFPPPNVTGVLHMGHALNNTMQDIFCRYAR
jgi:valyl-tRNA synthetase